METPKFINKNMLAKTGLGVLTTIYLINLLTGDIQQPEYRTIRACLKPTREIAPCEDSDLPISNLPIDYEGGNIYTDASGTAKIPYGSGWAVTISPDYPFDGFGVSPTDNGQDYLFVDPNQAKP